MRCKRLGRGRFQEIVNRLNAMANGRDIREELKALVEKSQDGFIAVDDLRALLEDQGGSMADLIAMKVEIVGEVFVSSPDFVDENKQPLPSDVVRAAVLDDAEGVRFINPIFDGYINEFSRAAAKNSKPSPKR